MKPIFLKARLWRSYIASFICICVGTAAPAWARGIEPGLPLENPSRPLAWVKNDAYRIKYKVPAHWNQSRHQTDSLTRITYTSPDGQMVLTVTKRKGNLVRATPRQWLDVMTRQFCQKEKLVFKTRYNRLTFWEATGFTRQAGRVGRYETLVTSHKGNTIAVYLQADCRLAYNRHQGMIYEVFSSVAPYRNGPF